MRKEKILIVDDDPDILDVLQLTLRENYEVVSAPNGKEGLAQVRSKNPDLIITDYMMPVMTGRELVKALKKDILLSHIPVIMLTGKGEVKDIVGGIEAGADDYLVKPFEPDTLLARIRMILRRTIRSLDANPLTHLPGNASIMEELQHRIDSTIPFAVGYADLDQFKIYNDKYGFVKGDEIIRATARLLINVVRELGGPESFIGHIGGDDFVFICDDKFADSICQKIIVDFDNLVPTFYNDEDRQNGFLMGKDRLGNVNKVNLLSISIGIVSNATHHITHVAQVGEIGAELKKFAKSFKKSNFVRDQRKD